MSKDNLFEEFMNSLNWNRPRTSLVEEVAQFLLNQYPIRIYEWCYSEADHMVKAHIEALK